MSTSTALAKRPSDTDLMPPPPPPKRIKRPPKVLDEETYTNALSHIIARDFFPGLLETETQQDYLNALEAGDDVWISEAEQKVRAAMTPGPRGRRGVSMTPRRREGFGGDTPKSWAGDTPRSMRSATATPSRRTGTESEALGDAMRQPEDTIDLNMGLTAFQAKYTSEDNESFNKVLDKQNAKRAEKYRWLWNGNKLPSKQQLLQAAQRQKALPSSTTTPTTDIPAEPTTTSITLRPSQNLDDRHPLISTKPSPDPRNNFMFTPPDISETHPTSQTIYEASQAASAAAPKSVAYGNTRLTNTSQLTAPDSSIPPSPSLSAIDAAIAEHVRHRADSTVYEGSSASVAPGGETPRVNGYAFVDAEATPSELGIAGDDEVEADDGKDTTSLLQQLISDSSGTGGPNPFTIHEPRARESLHHRLVERALALKRKPTLTSPSLSLHGSTSTQQTPSLSSSTTPTSGPGPGPGPATSLHTHILSRLTNDRTPTPKFMSSPRITKPNHTQTHNHAAGSLTPAAQQLYHKLGKTPVRGSATFGGQDGQGQGQGRTRERHGHAHTAWTPTAVRGVKRIG